MGHLVVIVFRILFVDIVKWGSVYLIIVPGFGIALFLLVRDQWLNQTTGLVDEHFSSIAMSIYRLFRHRCARLCIICSTVIGSRWRSGARGAGNNNPSFRGLYFSRLANAVVPLPLPRPYQPRGHGVRRLEPEWR